MLCINSSISSGVSNAVSALSRVAELVDMSSNDLIALKNHLTGLLDISMKSSKQHIEDFVETLTVDLTDELKKICTEVQSLGSLTIEMAAHCNEHNASIGTVRFVEDEVPLSLLQELAETAELNSGSNSGTAGWRLLGTLLDPFFRME